MPGVCTLLSRGQPRIPVPVCDCAGSSCRKPHRLLIQARRRYGNRIAVAMVVSPANGRCNSVWDSSSEQRNSACEFARLSLGLWKASPDKFENLENWIFGDTEVRTLAESLEGVVRLCGRGPLMRALADPWVEQRLNGNLESFKLLRTEDRKLPILALEKRYLTGTPEEASQLFETFERVLNGQPLNLSGG